MIILLTRPPPQRKREEGTREASGKRRCVREDDKKGYCEDVRIPFLSMLYRKSSPNKFHGNHILRRVREGEFSYLLILILYLDFSRVKVEKYNYIDLCVSVYLY